MTTNPTPRSFLPLTAAVFHVLLSLSDATRHGYGIAKDVEERTGGDVKLGPGTLYGTLGRLVTAGLVVEVDDDSGATTKAEHDRRRHYAMTPLGREVVRAEARRLAQLVDLARAKEVLG
jgi:DNA-binding PadR family transcriptional regulator